VGGATTNPSKAFASAKSVGVFRYTEWIQDSADSEDASLLEEEEEEEEEEEAKDMRGV